jgi:uracil-DNA glycosylase family protein
VDDHEDEDDDEDDDEGDDEDDDEDDDEGGDEGGDEGDDDDEDARVCQYPDSGKPPTFQFTLRSLACLKTEAIERGVPPPALLMVMKLESKSAKPARSRPARRVAVMDGDKTRTGTYVPGEGPRTAGVMMIGEVPGHEEDLAGRPFVGPAGKLLDRVLEAVGLDRKEIYLTNVVKRFKWKPRGKRRLHQKPVREEIDAAMPELEAELKSIQPKIVVCLGATAAQALLGRSFRVTRERGKFLDSPLAAKVITTVHPSSILRAPDPDARRQAERMFAADLQKVADAFHGKQSGRLLSG